MGLDIKYTTLEKLRQQGTDGKTHRLVTSFIFIPVLLSLWSFGPSSWLGHDYLWVDMLIDIFRHVKHMRQLKLLFGAMLAVLGDKKSAFNACCMQVKRAKISKQ